MTDNEKYILAEAVAAIYLQFDYENALLSIIDILGGKEAVNLTEQDPESAFYKYSCGDYGD